MKLKRILCIILVAITLWTGVLPTTMLEAQASTNCEQEIVDLALSGTGNVPLESHREISDKMWMDTSTLSHSINIYVEVEKANECLRRAGREVGGDEVRRILAVNTVITYELVNSNGVCFYENTKDLLNARRPILMGTRTIGGVEYYQLKIQYLEIDVENYTFFNGRGCNYYNVTDIELQIDDSDKAGLVENVISNFFLAGAVGTFASLSIVAGQVITIESLLFNQYDTIRLTFFNKAGTTNPNSYISVQTNITQAINDYFSFFSKLAIIAYMIILVYMGIRILLGVGAQTSAKYKELILYWVQGIVILFFFPYIIKYTIAVNDAFVAFIADNKDTLMTLGRAIRLEKYSQPDIPISAGSLGDLASSMASIMRYLIDENSKDYMSMMYQMGSKQGWLVYAICFMVMVGQLGALLVIYFKRLLTVTFLIAIFPLVTISYAIDKIGDGKSQAFGNWYKEFALNVFLQSFHAIVYVIGMALIFTLGQATGGKSLKDHWLLLVLVITFISKGDEMLKNIFNVKGGGGDSVKGVAGTMLQAKGAVSLAKGARSVASKTFGAQSHLGKAANAIGNARMASNTMQAARLNESTAMMMQAAEGSEAEQQAPVSTPQTVDLNAPQNLTEHAQVALDQNASEEARQQSLDAILAAANSGNQEEIDKLKENLTEEQCEELEDMLKTAATVNAMLVGGLTEVELNQHIEILLEQMKKGGMHKALASRIPKSEEELKALRDAFNTKLEPKKPVKATSKKKTAGRKPGAKGAGAAGAAVAGAAIAGAATNPTGAPTNRARYQGAFTNRRKPKPQRRTFKQQVAGRVSDAVSAIATKENRRKLAVGAGAAVVTKFNKTKATWKARKDIRGYEKKAIKDYRELNRLQKQFKQMTRSGMAGTLEYQRLERRIKDLQHPTGAMAKLKAKRAEYAQRGIYFKYTGRTQQAINRKAFVKKQQQRAVDTKNRFVGAFKAAKTKVKQTVEADRAAGRIKVLMRKQFLNDAEKRELTNLQALIDGKEVRVAKDGRIKLTRAQRSLNRTRNKAAVDMARNAVWQRKEAAKARASGDVARAAEYDQRATVLENEISARRRNGRAYSGDTVRGATRAQRMIDASAQRRASEAIRKIRANKSLTREQQETAIRNSQEVRQAATTRQNLRSNGVMVTGIRINGVMLTGRSAEERALNKAGIKASKRQDMKDRISLVGLEAKTSLDIIRGIRGGQTAARENYNKQRQEIGNRLKAHGIVIGKPVVVTTVARTADRVQEFIDPIARAERRASREATRTAWDNNTVAVQRARSERKSAAKELDLARKAMMEAGGDIAKMEAAKQRVSVAQAKFEQATRAQNDAAKELRKSAGKKGAPIRAVSNLTLGIIERQIGADYEATAKAERNAERKLTRAEARVSREEARARKSDTAIELVTETPYETPARRMARNKQEARARATATGTSKVAQRLNAMRDDVEALSAIRDTFSTQRETTQGAARDLRISTRQGFVSRTTEAASNALSGIKAVPGRVAEFGRDVGVGATNLAAGTYSAVTHGASATTDAFASARDAIPRVAETLAHVPSRVADAINFAPLTANRVIAEAKSGFKTFSDEVMALASVDNFRPQSSRPTITITGYNSQGRGESTSASTGPTAFGIPIDTNSALSLATDVITSRGTAERVNLLTDLEVMPLVPHMASATGSSTATSSESTSSVSLYSVASSVDQINTLLRGDFDPNIMRIHIENIKGAIAAASPAERRELEVVLGKLDYTLPSVETVVLKKQNSPDGFTPTTVQEHLIVQRAVEDITTGADVSTSFNASLYSVAGAVDEINRTIKGNFDPTVIQHHVETIKSNMAAASPSEMVELQMVLAKLDYTLPSIEATATRKQYAQNGFMTTTADEEAAVQRAFEASLREEARQREIEGYHQAYEQGKVDFGNAIKSFGKNAVAAAVDISVAVPAGIAGGLISAGMGASAKKSGELVTLNAATAGLAGYNLTNQAYQVASGFVKDTGNVAGSVANKIKKQMPKKADSSGGKSSSGGSGKSSTTYQSAADMKKEQLRGKTTFQEGILTKRGNNAS